MKPPRRPRGVRPTHPTFAAGVGAIRRPSVRSIHANVAERSHRAIRSSTARASPTFLAPPPPIDEAGWGRVPVAVGTRALGRARGVDARNFEAGRALGTPTRPLTPSVRSPTTPSPGAPSQWRPRRLRTQRGSGQRCPSLHRASASKNQSADGQIRGRSASRSGFR